MKESPNSSRYRGAFLDFICILNTDLRVGHGPGERPHLDSNVQNTARLLKKVIIYHRHCYIRVILHKRPYLQLM